MPRKSKKANTSFEMIAAESKERQAKKATDPGVTYKGGTNPFKIARNFWFGRPKPKPKKKDTAKKKGAPDYIAAGFKAIAESKGKQGEYERLMGGRKKKKE